MNKLLAAILLATSISASAELHERTVKVTCGSANDFIMTLEKYQERPVLFSMTKGQPVSYSLWANLEKGTTSWLTHLIGTDEYCMMGVGDEIQIPENSILKDSPIGTRVKYK